MVIYFKKNEKITRANEIRIQRIMNSGETRKLWVDAKIKNIDFDAVFVRFENSGSDKKVVIYDLAVETFD